MKEVTKSGRTVEEALQAALSELQTTEDRIKYEVIEESKKGFLGIGSKPAVVQVRLKKDPLETARKFLREVTEQMGVPIEIEESRDERNFIFTLSAEKVAILIGKRGNTLNALQYLTNVAANHNTDEHVHIVLDAENYRERRKETLEQLAKRMADKVRHTGRVVQLDPMPSMERKIIHIALKDEKGIVTHSEGADPNRRVIITPDKGE
ncbi:MAG TPA: RNA-binding cell elongation regulator Jag/EloR [Bacillales bacterium]|nr:RNA-binding cell elongation regulator Jag/EloR [Bacillales bacterium]